MGGLYTPHPFLFIYNRTIPTEYFASGVMMYDLYLPMLAPTTYKYIQ